MKDISILVPLGHSSLPNIDGTHQIFGNECIARAMGREPLFNVFKKGYRRLNTRGI